MSGGKLNSKTNINPQNLVGMKFHIIVISKMHSYTNLIQNVVLRLQNI
jgi:hypothetical protein